MRSTDGGKTFSEPLAVVDRQSQRPGLEFTVWDLAVGPEGRVHVALGTNAWKLKLPKEEWAFFYARLDPGAKSFAPVQNLNRQPSEGFSLAADERGNVTACWISGKLYAQVSHDHGATFGPAAEIDSTFDPCDCCTSSIAYGADGRLAVLYREETNNERDMHLVLWDQAKNHVSRKRVSTTLWKIDACPMTYYTVVPTKEGYEIVWPTEGQVYFAATRSERRPASADRSQDAGLVGHADRHAGPAHRRGRHARGLEEKRPAKLAALRRQRPAGRRSRIGKKSRQRRGGRPCTGRPVCALSLESLSPLIEPGDQSPRYVEHFLGSVHNQRIGALVGRERDTLPFEDGLERP